MLASAIAAAGRCSGLRDLVESTWLGLGAPACGLTQTQLEEAREYFDLLEQHEEAGDLPDFEAFEEAMSNLYAPPAADADESLQIMTIHQAKGLEFDSVILPGMGRGVRSGGNQLLRWAEVEGLDGEERLLMLAPIDAAGEEPSEIGEWLKKLAKQKDDYESLRLLYVACTRAREELHLIGHISWKFDSKTNSPVLKKPWHNSFLRHLWPEVAEEYEKHFAPLKKQLVQAIEAVFGEEEPEEVAAAEGEETYERVPTLLTRVSAAPVMPEIPDAPFGAQGLDLGASPSAAAGDEGEDEVFLRHASPEMKHAGTVVHAFLQRIGNDGIEQWGSHRIRAARPEIDGALRRLGVLDPQKRSAAADRVIDALEATLEHPEARHFFDPENTEVHNEWPITGMLGGRVVNGIIDRTFVDRDGIRWIVDYKTSAHEGSGRDEFLRRKTDLYRRQLDDYAALLAALHGCDVSSIRRALFFPLLGEIVQWQG
ncbi:MAG: PD-(D/E)XK nuclease family protein [Candidatus Sumerlaeaceae bacterium]|nr:PD-(D/E)XK nuclease family protein [Candidatus Sumerlaeaceae bacterium]